MTAVTPRPGARPATGRALPACSVPRDFSDLRLPIECVTVQDAKAYVAWLREKTSLTYRLPSEAEWEFAARAGAETRYLSGDTLALSTANIGTAQTAMTKARLTPVGSFGANAYGLHDVHGNVAEITGDCWVGSVERLPGDASPARRRANCAFHALRDAHAGETTAAARLSARRPIAIDARLPGVGFRVARTLN